jgi:hypothetical protein
METLWNLVFPYENERVTDAIGLFDSVGDRFHQRLLLLLRETWRCINLDYRHNSFLGSKFDVSTRVMETATDSFGHR